MYYYLSKIWKILILFIFFYFFNCYLVDPRPTLCHCWGDSLTNPMLITAFDSRFDPKVAGSLVTRLGPQAWPSAYWGLNRDPSTSHCNALTHYATLHKWITIWIFILPPSKISHLTFYDLSPFWHLSPSPYIYFCLFEKGRGLWPPGQRTLIERTYNVQKMSKRSSESFMHVQLTFYVQGVSRYFIGFWKSKQSTLKMSNGYNFQLFSTLLFSK